MKPENLVADFLASLSKREKKFYNTRNNCGPAALALLDYAKLKEFPKSLERVQGYFQADMVVSAKKDFTPEMKEEYQKEGFDFQNAEQRKSWVESHDAYKDDWRKVPHYWLIDEDRAIYDPSGEMQFVQTKLAPDLNFHRYLARPTLQNMKKIKA